MHALMVIVAHTPMASALKKVVQHLFSEFDAIMVYDILPSDDPDRLQEKIHQDIKMKHTQGQTILVFTDLIGATPSNIAMRVSQHLQQLGINTGFFTGTNACMLISAVRYADMPLENLKNKILESGLKGMQSVDCSM